MLRNRLGNYRSVNIGKAGFQFARPFRDGNGRLARLLARLISRDPQCRCHVVLDDRMSRGPVHSAWPAPLARDGDALFDHHHVRVARYLRKYKKSDLIPFGMEYARSKYTDSTLSGLGKGSRGQLAAVLRKTTGVVTPALAAEILSVSRVDAAKLLSRWTAQAWLQRVQRGIYVPVPLESERADSAPEDAWVIAEAAFSPCYISGWSAAEHWGLTEQVFRTVLVSTTRRPRNRQSKLGGIGFRLRTVNAYEFFGLKTVWRGRTQVKVTDATRTIVDLMADPSLGGGARSSSDMLQNYLASKEYRDLERLLVYAETLGVGAVFKRLGYLLSRFAPGEREAIARCRRSLTQGNAKLDPAVPATRLVTAWRLWLPEGWQGS